MDELLTVTQLAQELRVHYRTALKMVNDGIFEETQNGPQIRIWRSSVTAYLEARRTPASRELRGRPTELWYRSAEA